MKRLLRAVVDLVAPPVCASCGGPAPLGQLCGACRSLIPPLISAPPADGPLRSATTRAGFEGLVRRLTQDLKYQGQLTLAAPLGALLVEACGRLPAVPDLVVPMPLHPQRQRQRGFDQAWLLAGPVALELGVPRIAALRRVGVRPPQVGLPLEERGDNVRGVFEIVEPSAVAGLAVLLVDDVVTTGATAREAARVLLSAGASGVDLLTLAWAEQQDALR